MENAKRYQLTRNVTLIGIVANLGLSGLKIIVGLLGHSQALVADGLHSLSDLISDGIVLFAAHYSAQQADAEHPYGHARFETLATVAVGASLLLVAITMLLDVGHSLLNPQALQLPSPITLAVAILGIVVKEGLYQYTAYIARQIESPMLQANAWHHRTDAISSLVVLIGIAGALAGLPWLDAVAALAVSIMIAHIGGQLIGSGLRELVDTGADQDTLTRLRQTILSVDGVKSLHELRTRYMGAQLMVDVHVRVRPEISVSEGHYISDAVRISLLETVTNIADVIVHIDPENDQHWQQNLALPNREQLLSQLNTCWQPLEAAQAIEQINLHYLSGNLIVDIYLPFKIVQDIPDAQGLSQRFMELAATQPQVQAVRVYFYHPS